jgi:RNA polymerase sigma-70 factor (ECF subfamily)
LYEPLVRVWCRQQSVPDEDTSDIVQEVFVAVTRGIDGFRRERPDDTFRGWLYGITRHKIADCWRQRQNRPRALGGSEWLELSQQMPDPNDFMPDLSPDSVSPSVDGLYRRAVELIQSEFEDRTFQAFWCVTVDQRPAAEVARELKMSPGAVYVAKSRVLKRLRQNLEGLECLAGDQVSSQ